MVPENGLAEALFWRDSTSDNGDPPFEDRVLTMYKNGACEITQ